MVIQPFYWNHAQIADLSGIILDACLSEMFGTILKKPNRKVITFFFHWHSSFLTPIDVFGRVNQSNHVGGSIHVGQFWT
jgi:hypothetical protein